MNRGDMLIMIGSIEADKITDLLALHINDIERLAFADPCASALIGRYQYFLDYRSVSHMIHLLHYLFNEYCDGPDGGAGAFADFEREPEVEEALLRD
ncbi:hypothetical protein D3C80_1372940 [compost metagenome]